MLSNDLVGRENCLRGGGSILTAIPLTPWWLFARRQRNRREMVEHLCRYYANGR
jgi:hypothetical protein